MGNHAPKLWRSGRWSGLRIMRFWFKSQHRQKYYVILTELSGITWYLSFGVGGDRYPVELIEVPESWPGHHGYKKKKVMHFVILECVYCYSKGCRLVLIASFWVCRSVYIFHFKQPQAGEIGFIDYNRLTFATSFWHYVMWKVCEFWDRSCNWLVA